TRGSELTVTGLVEAADEVDLAVAQEPVDDAEPLLEAAHPVVVRVAEGLVLRLVPAGADPEDQAPAGDLLDGVGQLREVGGAAERHARDQRTHPDAGGPRGAARADRPSPPLAWRGALRHAEEEAIPDPPGVDPDLLGPPRHQADVAPARNTGESLVLGDGQLHADLQRPSSLSGHGWSSM